MTFEVLVSVEHADGEAGVLRDGEDYCLSGYLSDGGWTLLSEYWSSMEGLTGDRSVEGGRLPPGAVGAEVVDRSGRRHVAASSNGAWVIVLGEPTVGDPRPVRFLDEEGQTVRRPLPDSWPREPLPHRQETCPACGAKGWERARPIDSSFGMRRRPDAPPIDPEPPPTVPTDWTGWEPVPMLVCKTCGCAESEPISLVAIWQGDV